MSATMQVRMNGGPLDGHVMQVSRDTEKILVGPFFSYTFAGKQDGEVQFAKQPNSRKLRKFILWHIGKFGTHPFVLAMAAKQTPVRGRTDKRGRGARKRAASRQA